MSRFILVALMILITPLTALAQGRPTAEEVRKVINFFYEGEHGAVLIDVKICRGVHDDGEMKHECKDDITRETIQVDEEVLVWMNFFAPLNKKQNILIQFNKNGVTRDTKELAITGATRYRSWLKFKPSSAGRWEVKIYYDGESGAEVLSALPVPVAK